MKYDFRTCFIRTHPSDMDTHISSDTDTDTSLFISTGYNYKHIDNAVAMLLLVEAMRYILCILVIGIQSKRSYEQDTL